MSLIGNSSEEITYECGMELLSTTLVLPIMSVLEMYDKHHDVYVCMFRESMAVWFFFFFPIKSKTNKMISMKLRK